MRLSRIIQHHAISSFPRRACPREGVGRESISVAKPWIPARAGMTAEATA